MALLQVKVISALLTRDTETFSNMDPYTIIEVGSQKRKTRTHQEGGKKPQWNDLFTFSNPKGNMIRFIVMDEDTVSDDLVGEGALNLDKFIKNPTQQNEYVGLTYKGKASGKLYVSILYKSGNNQPTYPGNQINNNNVNPYNTNQNQGWGNNQGLGNNIQNNQGWGSNNTTNNQGWGSNNTTNNQGWGTNNTTSNQGWGTNNTTSNQGWGSNNANNIQSNQGWGTNPQNSQGWGNTQGNNNVQYPSLNVQNTGNNMNQQFNQQILNNLMKPNSQNIPIQNNSQKTNPLGILNVALQNGLNQTPPQNSGWNNQPVNNGWGTNQQPSNNGWGSNPYETNKGNNGW